MREISCTELKPYLLYATYGSDPWIDVRTLLNSEQPVYVSKDELRAVLQGREEERLLFGWNLAKMAEVRTADDEHLGYLHLRF